MDIAGSVALVTGSNRGIGRRFVTQLLERGASKVYATARRPELVDVEGVEVLPLDITDEASVAAAAAAAQDVTLLVNNAGIATTGSLLRGDLTDARREMDTHYWGTLSVLRAFAPVIERNGGGAVVNVLSALSWFVYPGSGGYAAAKAAEWNLTNAVRLELASAGITVQGLHLGAADTDIMAGYEGSMVDPADVARASLDGVEAGVAEVLVDEWSRGVKASLQGRRRRSTPSSPEPDQASSGSSRSTTRSGRLMNGWCPVGSSTVAVARAACDRCSATVVLRSSVHTTAVESTSAHPVRVVVAPKAAASCDVVRANASRCRGSSASCRKRAPKDAASYPSSTTRPSSTRTATGSGSPLMTEPWEAPTGGV